MTTTAHGAGTPQGGAGDARHGPPRIQLEVQTPRGLWSMTEPEDATRRPDYPISTKIQTVIDDARAVFKFVENDSKYTLFLDKEVLAHERTLASYQVGPNALLLLSVQGGNASGSA